MMFSFKGAAASVLVGLLVSSALAQHLKIAGINYTIQTFDVPGAVAGPASPSGARISDFGEVVGYYLDTNNQEHGFYKKWNSPVVAPFDDPNDNFGFSRSSGVTDAGTIAGGYLEGTNNLGAFTEHGFVYKNGVFTDVNVGGLETIVNGINNWGDMVGQAVNPTTNLIEAWISIRGNVTYLPNATQSTFGEDLNDWGEMTFTSSDSSGNSHAFYRSARGDIRTVAVPGAVSVGLASINDFGFAVGEYSDSSGNEHGFVYEIRSGKTWTVDIPGATQTYLGGLNNFGAICGHFIDSTGNAHCYVAYPSFF